MFEGDYQKLFDSPAAYEKVTREDVQKAAALVFQKSRRTVGVLESPPEEPRRRCARDRGGQAMSARRLSHVAALLAGARR